MNTSLKIVGWFQVIAGIVGAGYGGLVFLSNADNSVALAVAAIIASAGALSVAAGSLLLRGQKIGWLLSVLTQTIQLPAFSLFGTLYFMGLGAFLALGVYMPIMRSDGGTFSTHLQFGIGTDFFVALGGATDEQYVALNIVALAALLILAKNRVANGPTT